MDAYHVNGASSGPPLDIRVADHPDRSPLDPNGLAITAAELYDGMEVVLRSTLNEEQRHGTIQGRRYETEAGGEVVDILYEDKEEPEALYLADNGLIPYGGPDGYWNSCNYVVAAGHG